MRWVVPLVLALLASQAATGSPDVLRREIREAATTAQSGQLEDAAARLRKVVASEGFAALDPAEQHIALQFLASLALDLRDPLTALECYALSSQYAQADDDDWAGRFSAAYWRENWVDAAGSLVVLARHWPQRLSQLHDRTITTTFGALDSAIDEPARVELANALFDASWTLEDGLEPSHVWRWLAINLLARGQEERARTVVGRITSPEMLLSLRVDHRYAAIVAAAPEQFDIDRASAAARAKSAAVVRARPRSLRALMDHTYDLLSAGDNDAVLKLIENALARIGAAGPDAPPFDDVAEFRPWIMNNRAIALGRLGRRDEALAQLERARDLDEDGGTNVSQTINLAGEYLADGRAREALELVGQLDWSRSGMSPYGKMQMQGVRHAALLVSRLADAAQRNDALLDVQEGLELPKTAVQQEYERRRQAVLGRADVQAAVSKAGRREKFNIVL
ncbi:MAG: hypothetical protein AB7G76_06920 [Steroidobacteraceae bacterium]